MKIKTDKIIILKIIIIIIMVDTNIIDTSISVGIDLGTTYACVGIWRNNRVEIVNQNGRNIMPSMVGFDNEGRLIG